MTFVQPCIGLSCGGLAPAELQAAGAVEVYQSPAEPVDSLDRSPALHELVTRATS